MSENDQFNKTKFKFVIYHGHIHFIPISEENEEKEENFEVNF
ncbi:MAG: hypothetical protein ACFFEY_01475 [Candidatus Thorarchaeota archaeon]